MERLNAMLQRIRESFFVIPAAMVVGFGILARVAVALDTQVGLEGVPLVLSVSTPGGRAITTAVAGATITVAAIVFSVTALSTQIAASQYSPRSVAGFFDDRFQQFVIGLIVGTFAYSLLALAGFGGVVAAQRATPSLSVSLSVALGVASAIAIVAYIDHSLRRMRIGAVVRRIAEQTTRAVKQTARGLTRPEELEETERPDEVRSTVRSRRTGWVRTITTERLIRALPEGAVVRVEVRVGEAVSREDALATAWLDGDLGTERVEKAIRRAIVVGPERSLQKDPGFGVRQLVDIALRSLSPGINDPTTAVDVVHHLKVPLREILIGDLPGRVFTAGGARLYLPEAASRADHVHSAFSEIRLFAGGQPAVLRALLEVIADLRDDLVAADLEARGSALVEEARLVLAAAEKGGLGQLDLRPVLQAARRLDLVAPDDAPAGGG